jgi:hypothetical protein
MKAFLFLAASVVALMLLFGCAQKPEPTVNEPPAPPIAPANNGTALEPQAPCTSGNVLQKDDCFLALAKSKSDPQLCKSIYSVEKLDACYAIFANSSLEACKKIIEGGIREGCLAQNAKRLKSEEVCGLIADVDKRQSCLAQILPRCMLLNIEKRALCSALEKNDYSLCANDTACLEEYARNASDKNACYAISEDKDKYYCLAMLDGTAQTCREASLSAARDWCAEKTAIELGNVDGCDVATAGSDYRNNCYLYFAVKGKDSLICRKAAPEERRDDCFVNYSVQTQTVDACPKVAETLNRISCYYRAARENRMPSLCNPLQQEGQRRDCYSMGIFNDAGPVVSDCQDVDSPDWKDKCFRTAASKTYNQTLCGFIRPGSDKDYCDNLFGN